MRITILALGAFALVAAPAAAAGLPADPLHSPMWEFVAGQMFGEGATVRFDPRLKVDFPSIAENQRSFPVAIDARAIPGVKRLILFVDLNPIQKAIEFRPDAAQPMIEVRIKLDQRTPVRAAAQLADGSWMVNGSWIDAAGGGCSAPPVSRVKGDWALHLGEIRAARWNDADGQRLRLAVRHPMDTGFVDNIPTYYLEKLDVMAGSQHVATIELQASVAEDPVLTIHPTTPANTPLTIAGRDTNGRDYRATIAPASVKTASIAGAER